MRNSWIIARREFFERVGSRSFLLMAVAGPLVLLSLIYLLFVSAGNQRQHWRVLVADPVGLMDNRVLFREVSDVQYDFIAKYVEIDEFAKSSDYQKYDALIEINEKVITNKTSHIFYREKPSMEMTINLRYHIEKRLEEIVAAQYTDLSVKEFRQIKQPLNLGFINVYDPENKTDDLAGWAGMAFGAIIFIFIFLFGMTILRSVSREKSNRIVEILVSTVHPRALMLGKVLGIGVSAFLQFAIWMIILSGGLYFMRENLFVDIYDGANISSGQAYNEIVELVFTQISFSSMVPWFLVFFAFGYLFYGAFFAALGAISGSESDGQQFLLPLIGLLLFAMYAGYYSMENPGSSLAAFFHYLPFSSPVVVMVKLAQGYAEGEVWKLFVSLGTLIVSSVLVLTLAGKLYRNGLLQFGHSVRLRQVFQWLRMK